MQDNYQAGRATFGDESRALSLNFRQEAYETAVKAQRNRIKAGMHAAVQFLVKIIRSAVSVGRMVGSTYHCYLAKRICAANAAC